LDIRKKEIFKMSKAILTAESVTAGHIDKFCDLVSDLVLDECLRQDPNARVACETYATKGLVVVGGEIRSRAKLDYPKIVREAAARVGYNLSGYELTVAVHEQSPDIADAVDKKRGCPHAEIRKDFCEGGEEQRSDNGAFASEAKQTVGSDSCDEEQGAGDQGVMVGYATNETLNFMPLAYEYARRLTDRLELVRKEGRIKGIGSDGKSQVSAEFDLSADRQGNGAFKRFTKIVVSVQHAEDKDLKELKSEIGAFVIGPVFEDFDLTDTEILINPSGKFVLGGVEADTGLTGRKIVVDAYGPTVPVGGGAFSGKDPSKVDRSGAYMARHIAKNIVAANLADRCGVQLAYAIGKADPLALNIDTFGTGAVSDGALTDAVKKCFDLRPREIIRRLDLLKPVYAAASSGGHFGRDGFSWEDTEGAEDFRAFVLQ
jgi:S-adenosylmethionine synthetase